MNLFKIISFDFKNIVRNPMLLLCNTVYPLMLIGILGFIAKGGYGESGITSYDYYGITMMIFTILMIALTASNTFMEKNIKKGNIRLIYSPTFNWEIVFSKVISTFIFGSLCYTVIMLIENFIFNINCGGDNFIYVILIIWAFTLFMCSLGVFGCCICKSEELTNKILSPICLLLSLLGGAFFPVDSLGKTTEKLSYISPVKWVNEAVFKVIYDKDLSMVIPAILICILGSIVLTVIGKMFFKPEEYV